MTIAHAGTRTTVTGTDPAGIIMTSEKVVTKLTVGIESETTAVNVEIRTEGTGSGTGLTEKGTEVEA